MSSVASTDVRPRLWRSRWAAIGAAVAVTFGGGGLFAVSAASPESSTVAIDPVRILDTRTDVGLVGPFTSPVPQDLKVTGSIPTATGAKTVVPAGATGVFLNLTPVASTAAGFISVRPATATGLPTTSNVNFTVGAINPNAVLVELPVGGGDDGKIEITFDAFGTAGPTTEVLVDVVGYTTDTRIKAIETSLATKANSADVYSKTETDAAVAGSRQETITAGGVDGAFVFPAPQLTLGTTTIATTKAGHLELRFIGAGGLNCAAASSYIGWLEVDGAPVRSSRILIGENFDVAGVDGFSATNFSQKVLHGVTATPVAAGSHQVRARFACFTGVNSGASSTSLVSWIATVLTGTPTVAALELSGTDRAGDPAMACIVDANGKQTCSSE